MFLNIIENVLLGSFSLLLSAIFLVAAYEGVTACFLKGIA